MGTPDSCKAMDQGLAFCCITAENHHWRGLSIRISMVGQAVLQSSGTSKRPPGLASPALINTVTGCLPSSRRQVLSCLLSEA
jgi:hypothetical protein